jgi:hypothetical protein
LAVAFVVSASSLTLIRYLAQDGGRPRIARIRTLQSVLFGDTGATRAKKLLQVLQGVLNLSDRFSTPEAAESSDLDVPPHFAVCMLLMIAVVESLV